MSAPVKTLMLGLLAIAIAFLIPAIIDAPDNETREAVELTNGSSETIDDLVTLTVDTVNTTASPQFVNLTVVDVDTQGSATITNLSVDETKSATVAGEDVSVTAESIDSSDNSTVLTPSFSRTYAWDPAAAYIVDNFDLLFPILAFIMIGGLLAAVIP